MLVLRRKAGEAIILDGKITIYVLAVEGERVKLGIDAPQDVVIVRKELLEEEAGEAGSHAELMPSLQPPPPLQGFGGPAASYDRSRQFGSPQRSFPRVGGSLNMRRRRMR